MENDGLQIDSKIFGHIVRTERINKNLTMEQLSEMIDISIDYLGKIERGAEIPSLKIAYKLSQILNIGLDYLTSGSYTADTNTELLKAEVLRQMDILSNEQNLLLLKILKLISESNCTKNNTST